MAEEERPIFGLALDDKIRWATGRATHRTVTDIRMASCEIRDDVAIGDQLRDVFASVESGLIVRAAGIGVSSIGVVDSESLRLLRVARKNWLSDDVEYPQSPRYVADFGRAFAALAPYDDRFIGRIFVHNDSTAAALAEFAWAERRNKPQQSRRLFYLNVGEGVNAGVIFRGRPLSMGFHPEIGHIRAFRPPQEKLKRDDSACRLHTWCFEGVASAPRVRRSWGGSRPDFVISDLAPNHPAWEILASYIAQLCMIGALTFSPDRIIIGGCVMHPRLLPLVRVIFDDLNEGYLSIATRGPLIQPALFDARDATILGALELARLAAWPLPEEEALP